MRTPNIDRLAKEGLPMPYRRGARVSVTNEDPQPVNSFYSKIDYQSVPSLPEDVLYLHATYNQAAPGAPSDNNWKDNGDANRLRNPDGKQNYVWGRGRGG